MAEITIPNMAINTEMNIPQGGNIQSTAAYRNVREINKYDFMDHTYSGTCGYRDCSYLTPTAREMFYDDRRNVSYYVNAFKPIINAMVDPCFDKPIDRDTNNIIFEQFYENCDGAGTPLTTVMHNAIRNARIYSCNFLVMENYSAEEIQEAETLQDVSQKRTYPYIYEKGPQEVYKTECDNRGNLMAITFKDGSYKVDKKEYPAYRRFDNISWRRYYVTKKENGQDIETIIDEGMHNLGLIPVVAIVDFAQTASLLELPDPELYDIAFLCFGLFNKESQVCWMEIMQTFAILCTSGMGSSAKALGPATFLDSGTDSKYPPQYVAPPQDGIRTLIDNCQRLKEEIKTQAQQKGVIGIKEAASGISKEWDFRAEEAVLRQTAQACVRVEAQLALIFGKYINSDISIESKYPMEYSPLADMNKINSGLAILKEMPPKPLELAIWEEVTELYFKGDDTKIEEIEEAIEALGAEATAMNDMMNKQVPVDELMNEGEEDNGMQEQGQED